MAHRHQTKHRKPRHQDSERHSQAWDPAEHAWEEVAAWANRLKGFHTESECGFHASLIERADAGEWEKTLAWYGLTLAAEGSHLRVRGFLSRGEDLPYTLEGAIELMEAIAAEEVGAEVDSDFEAAEAIAELEDAVVQAGPEPEAAVAKAELVPAPVLVAPAPVLVAPVLVAPVLVAPAPVLVAPAPALAAPDNVAETDDILDDILKGL